MTKFCANLSYSYIIILKLIILKNIAIFLDIYQLLDYGLPNRFIIHLETRNKNSLHNFSSYSLWKPFYKEGSVEILWKIPKICEKPVEISVPTHPAPFILALMNYDTMKSKKMQILR